MYKIEHEYEKSHNQIIQIDDGERYPSSENSSCAGMLFVKNCAISNNIKYFLLTVNHVEQSVVNIYSMDTGLKTMELCGHTDEITTAIFSPEDQLVLTGSEDTTAIIWN